MKKNWILAILFGALIGQYSYAAEVDTSATEEKSQPKMETLMGKTKAFGGFVGMHSKVAMVGKEEGFLFGGSVGVLLNHSLGIGFAGYGLIANEWRTYHHFNSGDFEAFDVMEMGYGGLLIEPVIFPHKVVHITVPLLIGAGGVGIVSYKDKDNDGDIDVHLSKGAAFFVVEPGIGIQLNITNFMRVDIGASYRYIPEVFDLEADEPGDLSGFGGYMALKLGWF